MSTFFSPAALSGTAELTASTGLQIQDLGSWRFSQSGYNDGATFGLSLGYPLSSQPQDFSYGPTTGTVPILSGGELHLSAQNWTIAVIGNELTDYVGTDSTFYPANRCRITVRGRWQIIRQQNSNSFNGIGIQYGGETRTDSGDREMPGQLLTLTTGYDTYVIQGSAVTGGAQDTFSSQLFWVRCTETATSDNSNRTFQSNTVIRAAWIYDYAKSWQVDA
jgi:hypothetical protein